MKKLICLALLVVSAGLLSGCAAIARGPIFAPIAVDLMGPQLVSSDAQNLKRGEAMAKGILIVAMGDASIETAAKNGGIKKIHHVDSKTTNILGIYCEYTTIVYGE